jgi:1-acyl-sn-glycerol-3-phosphate acyltransferase
MVPINALLVMPHLSLLYPALAETSLPKSDRNVDTSAEICHFDKHELLYWR